MGGFMPRRPLQNQGQPGPIQPPQVGGFGAGLAGAGNTAPPNASGGLAPSLGPSMPPASIAPPPVSPGFGRGLPPPQAAGPPPMAPPPGPGAGPAPIGGQDPRRRMNPWGR